MSRDDSFSGIDGSSLGSEPGKDVLDIRVINDEEIIYVTALEVPLVPPPSGRVLVVDEKPLPPDTPQGQNITSLTLRSLTLGLSNQWTITPWLLNSGDLLGATIIVTGYKTLDAATLRATFRRGFSITSVENGLQTEATFVQDLKQMLKRVSFYYSIALAIFCIICIYICVWMGGWVWVFGLCVGGMRGVYLRVCEAQ